MTANQKAGAAEQAAPALPPLTVARFEEALRLVDRLYEANVDTALARLQDYQERHRSATGRPLTAEEAVRWAAVAHDILKHEHHTPAELQQSGLREYDPAGPWELLVAGGLATAPALLDAFLEFVALVEMDADKFRQAYDSDMVAEAVSRDAQQFAHLPITEAKERIRLALEHFTAFQDGEPGEALRSLIQTVTGALEQAVVRVSSETSQRSSSTGSAESTDGRVEASFTS